VERYITPYGSTTRLPLAQIYNEDARGQVTSRALADGMLTIGVSIVLLTGQGALALDRSCRWRR
jgi:hypothetical protein